MFIFFFFFKQKTAYEMRISDWSSDVCSSDLAVAQHHPVDRRPPGDDALVVLLPDELAVDAGRLHLAALAVDAGQHLDVEAAVVQRCDEGGGAVVAEAAEVGIAAGSVVNGEMEERGRESSRERVCQDETTREVGGS